MLKLMLVVCHNGLVGHSRGVASLCGGGGAAGVDCGTFVVGGPASAFLSGAAGDADFAGDVAVGVASPAILAGDVATEVVSPSVAGAVSLADLAGVVAIGVASPAVAGAASLADLAGDVAVGVVSPAIAGAASLADLAGDVAVGKASPAVAGAVSLVDLAEVVTIGVTPSAIAGVASLADAGVASLADAGVVALADLAVGFTIGVASLADAGVASLADAGVASLADAGVAFLVDLAGSVAGEVTNLAVLVCVRTEEMTLLQECVVRDPSVFDGSVYCDSEMDCSDCASPDAWCRKMPEIRDDLVCQYVNYVGCDPDCVDRTVPEGGDDCPFGTLSSEPLCVITDDMTYQEKIEALSATIYDYDDVNDNRPGYFDCNDPCDYEEWCSWDDPVEDGTCHDPYRSDVTGGGTVFSRIWLGVRSDGDVAASESTATEMSDRSPSTIPDLASDLGRKTGMPLSGFGGPITGDTRFLCMDARYRTIPELETDHLQKYRTSQVTSIERPECPCLGPVDCSPVIFVFCTWMPRCQTIPELDTDHPQKYRTSQVTSVERPGCLCLGLVNRSPLIFSLCAWTPRYRMMPELETDHPQKYRISQVTSTSL